MLFGYRELLTQHILVGPIIKCVCRPLIIYISTSQIGPFSPQVFFFFFGYKPTSLDVTYHALKPMKSYYTVYRQLPLWPASNNQVSLTAHFDLKHSNHITYFYGNLNSKTINGLPASLQHYLIYHHIFYFMSTYSSALIGNNRHWYSSHWGPPFTWYVTLISFLWMNMIVLIRLCKIVNCKWAELSWVLQIQN